MPNYPSDYRERVTQRLRDAIKAHDTERANMLYEQMSEDLLLEQSVRLLNEVEAVKRQFYTKAAPGMHHLDYDAACTHLRLIDQQIARLVDLWDGRLVRDDQPLDYQPL